jgi:hypothetical protein
MLHNKVIVSAICKTQTQSKELSTYAFTSFKTKFCKALARLLEGKDV